MSVWSGIGSTLGKQFAKRDALPFLAGAIGAFVLLPKFAYDESMYAVSFWYFFFMASEALEQNLGKTMDHVPPVVGVRTWCWAHCAHLLRAATIFNWVVTRQ